MDAPSKSRAKLLPQNAYTKLNPGEVYQPIVPAADTRAEVTPWSIGVGVAMVVVFTAACAYMALRAGNAIEASIPIAILAIFFGKMKKVRSTILENVMVQSVGQAAGVVAAGATFVIPALYINEQPVAWWQIFLATGIGGSLGVALIIPLRKYFVKDLHGELPFPEATAINEILVTGESSAAGAGKILLLSFALGALFDFSIEALHLWNSGLSTNFLPGGIGEAMQDARLEAQIAGIAALFGLGYIIGIKYASIIAAGSVLSVLVMVPMVYLLGKATGDLSFAGRVFPVGEMSAGAIFGAFSKPIGIGAIAISGLIGIMRMGKIVASSVSLGFKGLSRKGEVQLEERTQRDVAPGRVLLMQLGLALLMGALFLVVTIVTPMDAAGNAYPTSDAVLFAVVGMVVGFLLSFLFTPVAAQAIAIVGTNPVSGMTLITVALSIGAMILTGLKGNAGLIIALIIGTAVCTALSTSGALITDFKIGYWIGSTPRNQERWKFLGMAVAALTVAFVIPLMDSAYHFLVTNPETGLKMSNEAVLPAPQANMIAAVSSGLMRDAANQPWLLYGLGGLVAVLLFMAGLPMLAFALGMYLPIGINMAVLAGAFCAWLISKTGKSAEERAARAEQGTLIASGLMAGAAIFGILTAVLRLPFLGAPIQYISVGKDFAVEAIVAGEAVRKDGRVLTSCASVELKPGQTCSEQLTEYTFTRDDQGRYLYDQPGIAELDDQLADLQSALVNHVPTEDRERVFHAESLAAAEALGTSVRNIRQNQGSPFPVVGALKLRAALGRLVNTFSVQLTRSAGRRVEDEKFLRIETDPEKRAGIEARIAQHQRMEESLKALRQAEATAAPIDRELHPLYSHGWYEGGLGRGLGLGMIVLLGLCCFYLARLGARWQLAPPPEEKRP